MESEDTRYFCGKSISWIKEQYTNNKRTMQEIAEEMGCSRQNISGILQTFRVKARKSGRILYDRKKVIRCLKKGMSDKQIIEEIGCSLTYIGSMRKITGLYKVTGPKHPALLDKAWLEQKYLVEGMSQVRIAKSLGIKAYRIVAIALRQHGIPIRGRGCYNDCKTNRNIKYPQLHDPEWLKDLLNQGKRPHIIARELGTSPGLVWAKVKKFDLTRYVQK